MIKPGKNLLILVVGNVEHWHSSGRHLPKIADVEFCTFSDVTEEYLANRQPDIILAPLLCEQFDVLDLAYVLDKLNYEGRVRAITPMLPNPEIILGEIRFEYPALDFDLIQVQPGPEPKIV